VYSTWPTDTEAGEQTEDPRADVRKMETLSDSDSSIGDEDCTRQVSNHDLFKRLKEDNAQSMEIAIPSISEDQSSEYTDYETSGATSPFTTDSSIGSLTADQEQRTGFRFSIDRKEVEIGEPMRFGGCKCIKDLIHKVEWQSRNNITLNQKIEVLVVSFYPAPRRAPLDLKPSDRANSDSMKDTIAEDWCQLFDDTSAEFEILRAEVVLRRSLVVILPLHRQE